MAKVKARRRQRRSKPDPTPQGRALAKLGRIERLLEDLIILQGCRANANRHKLATTIGVQTRRVSALSVALKGKKERKKRKGKTKKRRK